MSLFEELKRRNVFRVAIGYLVLSWALLQVADIFFPAFGFPDWTVTLVLALLALGFIPVLIVSWIFELTPEGLKRDEDVVRDPAVKHQTTRKLDITIIVLLLVAIGMFAAQQTLTPDEQPYVTPYVVSDDKSIAVLPFLDLSAARDQEYFGDGIAEELLNVLVKINGLKVASRTSSFQYRGQDQDVRQIGAELGVSTVLEGSVRTSGNRVRITAQLVSVDDGYHLWSETYDRELDDIFALQEDIAASIVAALKIALHRDDVSIAPVVMTENVEAYQLYLRGRHFWRRRQADALYRSVELFKSAVELDPSFAHAWANLAATYLVLPSYDLSLDRDAQGLLAKSAAEQAIALNANVSQAHAVIAFTKEREGKWFEAEAAYIKAIENDPTDATARHWHSTHLMTMGKLNEALIEAEKAYELDSLDAAIAAVVGFAHNVLGQNQEALSFYRNAKELGWGAQANLPIGLMHLRLGNKIKAAEFLYKGVEIYGFPSDWIDSYVDDYGSNNSSVEETTKIILALADTNKMNRGAAFGFLGFLGSDGIYELANEPLAQYGFAISSIWQPEAKLLRQDPRMKELVDHLGLLPVWQKYGWPDLCRPVGDDDFECD